MRTASPQTAPMNAIRVWIGRRPLPNGWLALPAFSFADPWTRASRGNRWPASPRLARVHDDLRDALAGVDRPAILRRLLALGDTANIVLVTDETRAGLLQRRMAAEWLEPDAGRIDEIGPDPRPSIASIIAA